MTFSVYLVIVYCGHPDLRRDAVSALAAARQGDDGSLPPLRWPSFRDANGADHTGRFGKINIPMNRKPKYTPLGALRGRGRQGQREQVSLRVLAEIGGSSPSPRKQPYAMHLRLKTHIHPLFFPLRRADQCQGAPGPVSFTPLSLNLVLRATSVRGAE